MNNSPRPRFFDRLNGRLKPYGFQVLHTQIESEWDRRHFNYAAARLWPLDHLMIRPEWTTRGGKRMRTNDRSFQLVNMDKRDLEREALRIARAMTADLIPNDGHPSNAPANWDDDDHYIGPAFGGWPE